MDSLYRATGELIISQPPHEEARNSLFELGITDHQMDRLEVGQVIYIETDYLGNMDLICDDLNDYVEGYLTLEDEDGVESFAFFDLDVWEHVVEKIGRDDIKSRRANLDKNVQKAETMQY